MALDKQKILSDLGSVMNQLQSAECGCMGKMFSNSGQAQGMGSPMGAPAYGGQHGCQHGCWRNQTCGHPYSGEPYNMNQQAMGQGNPCMGHGKPCMGHCNPKELYANTYGYLNQNLMQPVVREVYDDLRSISPANTVMNDALGTQLGLAQGAPKTPVVHGNMGAVVGQNPMGDAMGGQNAMQNMGGMSAGNAMNSMPMGGQQQQGQMGGMGAEIMNMMMSSNKSKPTNMAGQGGQQPSQDGAMNSQMAASQGQYANNMGNMGGNQAQPGGMTANAAQYHTSNMAATHGQYNTGNMGATQGQYNTGNMGATHGQYNTGNMGGNQAQHSAGNMGYGNAVPQTQNPTTQYATQPNMFPGGNTMAGNMNQNAPMGNMQQSPGGQQMPAAQRGNYGQHSAGMAKFNEMFPGVTQGLGGGGELDFDPMSIAIQMNPANKQNATMDTMKKLLTGNSGANKQLDANAAGMKPVMNGMNAVAANFTPNQGQPPPNQYIDNQQATPNQQQYASDPQTAAYQPNQMQQQIVNTAITDQRTPQQQQIEQNYQEQQQINQEQQQNYQEQQQVQQISNSGGAPVGGYPNQVPAPPQQAPRDPIYPVDTSKSYVHQEYNTLGQPIQPVPAKSFHYAVPNLPQTLSPQPVPTKSRNEPVKYNNVKATVSKTSLFENRPSRSQLQHVYNQYKGSQSFTNQNIRDPVQQQTASDGRLNVNQAQPAAQRHVPVERVGGDTIANNQAMNQQVPVKGGHDVGQLGDVAANTPQGDADKPMSPVKSARLRNGLQDMVFTSYPQSTAWSFHGHMDRQPYSAARRYRRA